MKLIRAAGINTSTKGLGGTEDDPTDSPYTPCPCASILILEELYGSVNLPVPDLDTECDTCGGAFGGALTFWGILVTT